MPSFPLLWRQYGRNTMSYLAPFLLFLLIDSVFIRKFYFLYPTDGVPGFFGLGLNWIERRPLPFFHQPSYFFQEISAVLIFLTGTPGEHLTAYAVASIVVSILFLLIAGLWMGIIGAKLNLNTFSLFTMGLITIAMPTMMLMMVPSYVAPFSLAPPLILTLYALCSRESAEHAPIAFFVLGFIVANFFLAGTLLVATLSPLVYFFLKHDTAHLRYRFPQSHGQSRSSIIIQSMLLTLFLVSVELPLFFPTGGIRFGSLLRFIILGASIAAIVILANLLLWKSNKIKLYWDNILHPLLWGWATGSNVMIPAWGMSGWYSWISNGATTPLPNAPEAARNALGQMLNVLFHSPWNLFIFMSVMIGLIALRSFIKKRQWESLLASAVILTTTVLTLAIISRIFIHTSISQWLDDSAYNVAPRYVLPLIASAIMSMVWSIKKMGVAMNQFLMTLALIVSAASFWQYSLRFGPVITARSVANQQISAIAENFLQEDRNNKVICVRTTLPDFCAVLYGFNNYRNESAPKKTALRDGRIIYRENIVDCDPSPRQCLLRDFTDGGRFLIIAEKTNQQWQQAVTIRWQSPIVDTFAGTL